jgi:tRNA (adenine57-N1/adenine58-N1)-methyltransferase
LALLIDKKARRYLVRLAPGSDFHTHAGTVAHDQIIGAEEGRVFRTSKGAELTVFRPTLSDYILKMPRGAQVIYPKDLGPILMLADVGPGCRVLESGVGSGALSMALLRSGADIVGYEIREDFAGRARNNVEEFLGSDVLDKYSVQVRDCYEGIDETELDRVLLDLPEPWQVVPHAAGALRSGGTLLAYTPSVTQVMRLRESLDQAGFVMAETTEVLNRTWHVDGASVRPDHRMVAHTGFLTHARATS